MSAPPEEDKKPSEHINIRVFRCFSVQKCVVGHDNNEVFFKIKRHTPLKKLMEAYCERQGKSMNMLRFLVDGERARPEQTPAELDMEDGDQIEVMIEQASP
ncbi:hypothetical protein PORY_002270 [Pneumocystis oryctolagi]|uniref:Uncharacterized protein n=1 Tax=Pneumocystis oryctolagi TaxID=42067 RepID=A0ACB7CA08_9ASCO|nr:hypothetical protein PORY_002270 [Pneumocystis oryctolagi]